MLMDVITSPRGSARCGKEWSCRAESIFAPKGKVLQTLHKEIEKVIKQNKLFQIFCKMLFNNMIVFLFPP